MAMNERGDRSAVQEAVALFPEGWRTAYLVILGMLLGVGLGIAALEEFLWHGKIEFVVRILAVAGHGGGVTPVSVLLAVFLTEAWRSMALLSEKLRDRIRNQGRAAERVEASSIGGIGLTAMKRRVRKGEPFDEPPPDKAVSRTSGHGGGLRLSRFCWRYFLRRLGEVWHSYPRNSGTGFATKGALRHLLDWRKWFDRYEEARRKGEPFNEPPPDGR